MLWKNTFKKIFLKQKAGYIQSQAFQWFYCNVVKTAETLQKKKKQESYGSEIKSTCY